jgi:hypothetical protein
MKVLVQAARAGGIDAREVGILHALRDNTGFLSDADAIAHPATDVFVLTAEAGAEAHRFLSGLRISEPRQFTDEEIKAWIRDFRGERQTLPGAPTLSPNARSIRLYSRMDFMGFSFGDAFVDGRTVYVRTVRDDQMAGWEERWSKLGDLPTV